MINTVLQYLTKQGVRNLLFVLAMAILCLAFSSAPMPGGVCAEVKGPLDGTEFKIMEGRWVRPDGGYILELRAINKDGSLTATYFNPRPIKVFHSQVSRKEGKITLFVELRDINYPGSTYYLTYDPTADRLHGTYFQAVERQTFSIEFVRVK